MRGPSRIVPAKPAVPLFGHAAPQPAPSPRALPVVQKKRVLFVCIGNSCRSQLAEGFAKAYGSDVMIVSSAGLSPATMISPLTRQTLQEFGIDIADHFPKALDLMPRDGFDWVVNISGEPLIWPATEVIDWCVADPIGRSDEFYREIANQVEALVMRLILELRSA